MHVPHAHAQVPTPMPGEKAGEAADSTPVAKLLSVSDQPSEAVVVAQAMLKAPAHGGIGGMKALLKEKKEKKEPPPPKEKKEKKVKINIHDYCDPKLRLTIGAIVEVRQRDGTGFDGAWYTAAVMEVLPGGRVRVQYEVGTEYVDEVKPDPEAPGDGHGRRGSRTRGVGSSCATASIRLDACSRGGTGAECR